jgi:hypothetical protein
VSSFLSDSQDNCSSDSGFFHGNGTVRGTSYDVLVPTTARTVAQRLLAVYFGTPNMFVTLWFGFYYVTNPPLGTLII